MNAVSYTHLKLENDVFAAAGIAQKNNCALTRLDYQQEAGLMSSVPLGENLIPIQRGLTTSSTAIFIPFITQELFQTGAALYYGLNALSNNMILCDRKQLKNPNGLILSLIHISGHLIEDFFPRNGVRYIAMNDGIDTLRDNNDIAPFKNILNEMYSKDISKKVHSSYPVSYTHLIISTRVFIFRSSAGPSKMI